MIVVEINLFRKMFRSSFRWNILRSLNYDSCLKKYAQTNKKIYLKDDLKHNDILLVDHNDKLKGNDGDNKCDGVICTSLACQGHHNLGLYMHLIWGCKLVTRMKTVLQITSEIWPNAIF